MSRFSDYSLTASGKHWFRKRNVGGATSHSEVLDLPDLEFGMNGVNNESFSESESSRKVHEWLDIECGQGGGQKRESRRNKMIDWEAVSRENALYLRRSLGQHKGLVKRRVQDTELSLPIMTVSEIDAAEDVLSSAMQRLSEQFQKYIKVASDDNSMSAEYFEIGQRVKAVLSQCESQKARLVSQQEKAAARRRVAAGVFREHRPMELMGEANPREHRYTYMESRGEANPREHRYTYMESRGEANPSEHRHTESRGEANPEEGLENLCSASQLGKHSMYSQSSSSRSSVKAQGALVAAELARKKLQLFEERSKRDLERKRKQIQLELEAKSKEAELKRIEIENEAKFDLERAAEELELKELSAKLWGDFKLELGAPGVSSIVSDGLKQERVDRKFDTPAVTVSGLNPDATVYLPIKSEVIEGPETGAVHSVQSAHAQDTGTQVKQISGTSDAVDRNGAEYNALGRAEQHSTPASTTQETVFHQPKFEMRSPVMPAEFQEFPGQRDQGDYVRSQPTGFQEFPGQRVQEDYIRSQPAGFQEFPGKRVQGDCVRRQSQAAGMQEQSWDAAQSHQPNYHTGSYSYTRPESVRYQEYPRYPGNGTVPVRDMPTVGAADSTSLLAQTLERITSHSELPAPAPMTFDGTAAEFPKFMKSFGDRVDSKPFSDSFKLSQLVMCTTGEVKRAVQRYEGTNGGYQQAVHILQERYGRPSQIVKSCIDRITTGPRIAPHDRRALMDFSDVLEATYHTLDDYDLLREASTQTTLKSIFDRFPIGLQDKWVKLVLEIEAGRRQPDLWDMVKFVIRHAKASNHAVYKVSSSTGAGKAAGGNWKTKSNASNAVAPPRKVTTLSTQAEAVSDTVKSTNVESKAQKDVVNGSTQSQKNPAVKKGCIHCRGPHHIRDCQKFKGEDLESRRRIVRVNRLCFSCLGPHLVRNCRQRKTCQKEGCEKNHHVLLHSEDPGKRGEVAAGQKADGKQVQVGSVVAANPRKNVHVLLKVIPVRVTVDNGNSVTTFGILDTGSSTTLVTRVIADKLGVSGTPDVISVNTVLARGQDQEVSVFDCTLSPVGTSEPAIPVRRANIITELHIDKRYHPSTLDLSEWAHLRDLDFGTRVDEDRVSVLIGEDVPMAHAVLESSYGENPHTQPYAVRTPLAWCIAGPTSEEKTSDVQVNLNIIERVDHFTRDVAAELKGSEGVETCDQGSSMQGIQESCLEKAVARFWQEEKHGFGCDGEKAMSVEDKRALETLEGTTKFVEGNYEIGMLWKDKESRMPSNKFVAERRLDLLGKRFKKRPEFAEMYRRAMQDNIDKGYARRLTSEEAAQTGAKTWYLPHHGVESPNKPGKVRVVFDAAAAVGGTSLNSELLQGPDLTNNLVGVLLRFRQQAVAVAADIEGMFMQFTVPVEDQEALRFLWWEKSEDEPPSTYVMTRHIFGASDSPCVCTYGLRKCAAENEADFDPGVAETVKRDFYVDDWFKSLPTDKQVIDLALQLIEMLGRGGLKLRKFISSSKGVLSAIPEEFRASTGKPIEFGETPPTDRALGVRWSTEKDTLSVAVKDIGKPDTRRGCLATVTSLFDPMGIVGPVTLPAKRILQMSTKLVEWDDRLPETLRSAWQSWKDSLRDLDKLEIPRVYFKQQSDSYELHHFADASEVGYGTVSYLRRTREDGTGECSFVMAKGRTAPSVFVSVPRLELQAAVVAARMDKFLQSQLELPISRAIFWTDSRITLQYIRNETRRFKTYVANRITEIRDSSSPEQWRHVPGRENPADDISRGQTVSVFVKNKRWFNGPKFLQLPEVEWPETDVGKLESDDPELKAEKVIGMLTKPCAFEELLKRYSSWTALQRKVVILVKFCQFVKSLSVKGQGEQSQFCKDISQEDLNVATEVIVREVQRSAYAEEIADIEKIGRVKTTSTLRNLNPVMVKGILRVGGRLSRAPLSYDSKYPMILPKSHHVSMLLILHCHIATAHAGQEHVLAKLREKFWIPKVRSTVRKTLRSCVKCRKLKGVRMKQIMADLPKSRLLAYEPPFTRSGVDCFGPLLIKRGRSTVKRWGVLFTCLNVRAIHIEVVESMDTSSFLNALRRFTGRRGDPSDMWSDNGSNFLGGERELREAIDEWNQEQIKEELRQRGITWHFQPPTASHMSGVWERLVRAVKLSLKAILGNSLVSDEVLTTTLVEVERVLNSRPLCKSSEDPKDDIVLTPSHFLLQRGAVSLPPGIFHEADKYHRKKWRQVQILADHFWKRFLKEYMPTLQQRTKWQLKQRNVEVGDLVLVADDNVARGHWPTAIVTRTFPGQDGCVRVVEVRTKDTLLKRPVLGLCLLLA